MRACLAAIFVLFLWSKPLWALLYSSSSFAFTPPCSRTTFSTSQLNASASGLYCPFSEHALTRLEQSGLFIPSNDIIPAHLQRKEVPAKGNMPPDTMVRIETRALTSRYKKNVAYARCALLETLLPSDEEVVSTKGIQVLNIVIFPSIHANLPLWGVDLVSLPGDKHLLATDVQPMSYAQQKQDENYYSALFHEWYVTHVENKFEWGGDLPKKAAKFFSPYALRTRLQGAEEAISLIQGDVWEAFVAHLELYLQVVKEYSFDEPQDNVQEEYLQYRLENDPARPMLQSLYRAEWTEQLLTQVLFPKQQQ
jgi:phycoerythrobilin:ferredoxin oxidoreductase